MGAGGDWTSCAISCGWGLRGIGERGTVQRASSEGVNVSARRGLRGARREQYEEGSGSYLVRRVMRSLKGAVAYQRALLAVD